MAVRLNSDEEIVRTLKLMKHTNVKEYGLSNEFSKEVLAEAKKVSKFDKNEIEKRTDLRTLEMFTIDGEDAKDLDDAVRVAKVKNMYEQDLRKKYTFDVDFHPSVNYIQTADGIQPTAGLTLALKF